MNGKDASGAIRVAVKRKIFPAVGDREAQLVLQDIAFEVAPRSFLVITGPSGCGKSTLLYMVGGFVEPSSGTIAVGALFESNASGLAVTITATSVSGAAVTAGAIMGVATTAGTNGNPFAGILQPRGIPATTPA